MAPGGAAYADVVAAFGTGILAPDGAIDRQALGRAGLRRPRRARAARRPRPPASAGRGGPPGRRRSRRRAGAVLVSDAALLVEAGVAPPVRPARGRPLRARGAAAAAGARATASPRRPRVPASSADAGRGEAALRPPRDRHLGHAGRDREGRRRPGRDSLLSLAASSPTERRPRRREAPGRPGARRGRGAARPGPRPPCSRTRSTRVGWSSAVSPARLDAAGRGAVVPGGAIGGRGAVARGARGRPRAVGAVTRGCDAEWLARPRRPRRG